MLRGHLEKERVESQEREEAHLYTSISIVTEDDLREQVASKAFGLGEVGLGGKKRRMRANTRFRDVVEMMEKELEVPQSRLRFWRFEMVSGSATDNSYRPRTPISEDKYDKEIGTVRPGGSCDVHPPYAELVCAGWALAVDLLQRVCFMARWDEGSRVCF